MKPTFYLLNFIALQYLIAGLFFIYQGQLAMGAVYFCYGIANVALSFI